MKTEPINFIKKISPKNKKNPTDYGLREGAADFPMMLVFFSQ
jgi:hypothetical protein